MSAGHGIPGGTGGIGRGARFGDRGPQPCDQLLGNGPTGIGQHPDFFQLLDPLVDGNAVGQQGPHPQYRHVGRLGRVGHIDSSVVGVDMLADLRLEGAWSGRKSIGTR